MASAGSPSPGDKSSAAASLIRLGRITGTQGLKGALRFRPDTPDSSALEELTRVFFELGSDRREYTLISSTHAGRDHLKLVLKGIETIEAAEELKGAVLFAAESDFPPLGPGEFYYFQMLGMEVRLTDGRVLGTIEETFFNGANDVWVVRNGKAEVLVPVIEDVVKSIDFSARRATIEAVQGLLN
jgi:16S rRNA processing protein RimM